MNTPPDISPPGDALFRKLLLGVSVLAGLTHLAFLALFWASGVAEMAVVNVASILCYVLAFSLLWHGRVALGWAIIMGEVVAHAALAVLAIGWDSGFHLYIMLVPPVMVVSTADNVKVKVPVVGAMVALYVGLDLALRQATPVYPLEPAVLNGLHYFNLLTVMLLLVCLAALYYRFVLQSEQRLREMATTDPLTRLRNRRSVLLTAQAEAARQRRDGRPLSFVVCDLDHFKSINDEHGHAGGDRVLKAVSEVLAAAVREVDHAARWGGEEFLLLLPETSAAGAMLVASRIRHCVQNMDISHQGAHLPVTITLGVSSKHMDESVEHAIARADRALYRGKAEGRNRVALADEDAFLPPRRSGLAAPHIMPLAGDFEI